MADAEEIGDQVEYILSQGEEVYNFLFANPSTLETIGNIISINWNNTNQMGRLIKQQLRSDLYEGVGDKWREDHEQF